ncbi:MAG TPA: hypothetical protein VKM55_25100 [Candidatus Lokiarchaeia archaeon]|nr:hypothetical protein [Candidatus Lokiarchaeia archaeon]
MRKLIENDVPGLQDRATIEKILRSGQSPSIEIDGNVLDTDYKNYKKLKKAVEEHLK